MVFSYVPVPVLNDGWEKLVLSGKRAGPPRSGPGAGLVAVTDRYARARIPRFRVTESNQNYNIASECFPNFHNLIIKKHLVININNRA